MTQREAFEAIYSKRFRYHTTSELDAMLQAWNAATAAERERCAVIADDHDGWDHNPANCIAGKIMEGAP